MTKICRICLIEKDLTDYHWDSAHHRTRSHRCKQCTNEYGRRWKAANYARHKKYNDEWYQRNKERAKAVRRLRIPLKGRPKKTPEQAREARWRQFLKRYHQMTVAIYEAMIARQDGKCAICRRTPTMVGGRRALYIDHNHETGITRELLCYRCNSAIGFFEEDQDVMLAAIDYLRKHASNK